MTTDQAMKLFKFPMPDIGEGVAEGEIVTWHIQEGDDLAEDAVLCEVMTDKATVEITSPLPGKVLKLCYGEGEVVPVGAFILHIEPAPGAHIPTVAIHGDHDEEESAAEPAAKPGAPAAAAPAAPAVEEFTRPDGERALATPYTRKLARTLGLDIETIRGTGDVGRVTPDDVERHTAASAQPAAAPAPEPTAAPAPARAPVPVPPPVRVPVAPGQLETRVPIRGLRKRIAEKMQASKNTAAHFTYVDEVDVTELVKARRELKVIAAERGAKLTYLPFIMKAVVSALRSFPTLNGLSDDAAAEFVIRHDLNFGIAVDTDNGLIVPVVKNVDQLSLLQLANEIARVAGDARNGKSKLEDLQGGTFTITNAGNIGGLFATPVINYPEAAILGVHAINRKPWVMEGDRIEVRDIMYLSISIDHRMNDGATGAHFMNHVIHLLEDPKRLLLEI